MTTKFDPTPHPTMQIYTVCFNDDTIHTRAAPSPEVAMFMVLADRFSVGKTEGQVVSIKRDDSDVDLLEISKAEAILLLANQFSVPRYDVLSVIGDVIKISVGMQRLVAMYKYALLEYGNEDFWVSEGQNRWMYGEPGTALAKRTLKAGLLAGDDVPPMPLATSPAKSEPAVDEQSVVVGRSWIWKSDKDMNEWIVTEVNEEANRVVLNSIADISVLWSGTYEELFDGFIEVSYEGGS